MSKIEVLRVPDKGVVWKRPEEWKPKPDPGKRPDWLPSSWKKYTRLKPDTLFTCRQCGEQATAFLEKNPGAMARVHRSTFLCDSPDCESAARKAIGGGE